AGGRPQRLRRPRAQVPAASGPRLRRGAPGRRPRRPVPARDAGRGRAAGAAPRAAPRRAAPVLRAGRAGVPGAAAGGPDRVLRRARSVVVRGAERRGPTAAAGAGRLAAVVYRDMRRLALLLALAAGPALAYNETIHALITG